MTACNEDGPEGGGHAGSGGRQLVHKMQEIRRWGSPREGANRLMREPFQGLSVGQLEIALRAFERLNVGLFIHRQDQRVLASVANMVVGG